MWGNGSATAFEPAHAAERCDGENFSTGKPSDRRASSPPTRWRSRAAQEPEHPASAQARFAGVPGLTRNLAPAATARATSIGHLGDRADTDDDARRSRPPSPATHRGPRASAVSPPAPSGRRPASARASGTASATRSMISTGMTGVVSSGVGSARGICQMWADPPRAQGAEPCRLTGGNTHFLILGMIFSENRLPLFRIMP